MGDNRSDEAAKPWMIRDVPNETRKKVRLYAVENDLTMAQAVEAIVDSTVLGVDVVAVPDALLGNLLMLFWDVHYGRQRSAVAQVRQIRQYLKEFERSERFSLLKRRIADMEFPDEPDEPANDAQDGK